MSKTSAPEPPPTPESDRGGGVVRAAKMVPTLERLLPAKETQPQDKSLPCSGRCGHCDCHPCQLHAPI